jgi:hypothetical protein
VHTAGRELHFCNSLISCYIVQGLTDQTLVPGTSGVLLLSFCKSLISYYFVQGFTDQAPLVPGISWEAKESPIL